MGLTRRELLARGAVAGSAALLAPSFLLRRAFAGVEGSARNLVLIELNGGNDGMNTVVPYGVQGGAYYHFHRKKLAVPEGQLHKIAGAPLGFHPAFAELAGHYAAGRLAVIQGVGVPEPSFSHAAAQRIWHTALLGPSDGKGWVTRFLEQLPPAPFPSAAAIAQALPSILHGAPDFVPTLTSLADFVFPVASGAPEDGHLRKQAYTALANALAGDDTVIARTAATQVDTLALIDAFQAVPPVAPAVPYPGHALGDGLRLVMRLLASGLGLRIFHLELPGFDTHDDQDEGALHALLLGQVSKSLNAFQQDLMQHGLADDTLVLVFSEFGRTVRENGSHGTDHGTVQPIFVLGTKVIGGIVNEHPPLIPSQLDALGEPKMQVDFRDVLGTVLMQWLGASAGEAQIALGGWGVGDLGFL